MSEYTKGPLLVKVFPLTIGANHDYHVCTEREECVATCWGEDAVAEANAKLFATAGELLEALKLAVESATPHVRTYYRPGVDCTELVEEATWEPWVDAARAAIAKTEGR